MLIVIDVGLQTFRFAEAIRIVKESEFIFGFQHSAACIVNVRLRYPASLKQSLQL